MGFLLPALAAGVSDVLILYLNATYKGNPALEAEEEHRAVMNASYMNVLAVIRLLLLLFPLPYHSYTGTAVKFPLCYQLFYAVSTMVLLGHVLAIIMLDPNSLTSLVPSGYRRQLVKVVATLAQEHHVMSMRHVWLDLTLSFVSTAMHVILFWHVRSSAPSPYLQLDRKRVLYYYAQQQQQRKGQDSAGDNENNHECDVLIAAARVGGDKPNNHVVRDVLVVAEGGGRVRQNDLIEQMKLIPEGYDDFMTDLQSRLSRAKHQWSTRLEDFTKKVVTSSSTHGPSPRSSGGGGTPFLQASNTPFRVLLQLFAYQEVLANGRLDQAFDVDDGEAMTFYVPQLLSFLLHGAYDCSPQLEEWILEKCKRNVHFAHRCYWFLRSWCLEVPAVPTPRQSTESLSRNPSEGSLQQHRRSNSNASSMASWNGDDGLLVVATGSARMTAFDSPLQEQRRPSKLHPEERTLIEGLMFRVMECGEIPARTLQYGSGQVEEEMNDGMDETSPSALMTAIESGLIPIDPSTGGPSMKHMDSLTARRQFGFLPLESSLDREPVPGGGCFMSTPRFLDALTTMADNLFLIPRERRLTELRRQLQLLEVEFLPSNDIYIPLKNTHHRVWRIVSEESIAISTKERVPCIIYLEVINYAIKKLPIETDIVGTANHEEGMDESGSSYSSGTRHLIKTSPGKKSRMVERDAVSLWQNTWRDPQRHNSLLDKVTTFTQMGFKKLREQHGNDALFWIHGDNGSWHDSIDIPCDKQTDDGDRTDADLEEGLTLSVRDGTPVEQGSVGTRPPLPPAPRASDNDTPTTPPQSSGVENPFEMGQWSSPTGASYVRNKPKRLRNLSKVKAARKAHDKDEKEHVQDAVDALVGIRSSMERFNDRDSQSFGESSPHSSNQKTTTSSPGQTTDGFSSGSKRKSRPPPVVFKESFAAKQERVRKKSAYGSHPGWRLLPILIKSNDDLRQEELASQLIFRMASILAKAKVPVWLCPYEIIALTDSGGVIEAIPDTISIDSLKRNSPNFTSLGNFFLEHFGERRSDEYADAKACFVESLAAYSIVCFLLQIKDRHNGNILLDNRGHLVHIDFGFYFLSSPGKNSGFESAPFKLTRDFVDLMDGPDSKTFRTFSELCCRTFLCLRKNCHQIIVLVEMLMVGNEDLPCFRGRPQDAVKGLRDRFRLDLNDRACMEYVNALVDESLENWRTRWYDRYQRYCVGVL